MSGGSSRQGLALVADDASALCGSPIGRELARSELTSLLDACLGDLLANLIQLSGVSFTVAAATPAAVATLRQTLPPGVNVVGSERAGDQRERVRSLFTEARDRGVARIVMLAGDTLALPAATAGTAFGVLESADLVVGATRTGPWYLAGARDEAGIAAIIEAGSEPERLLQLASERDLLARRLEPRRRLATAGDLDELRDIPGLGPRVGAWLADHLGVT